MTSFPMAFSAAQNCHRQELAKIKRESADEIKAEKRNCERLLCELRRWQEESAKQKALAEWMIDRGFDMGSHGIRNMQMRENQLTIQFTPGARMIPPAPQRLSFSLRDCELHYPAQYHDLRALMIRDMADCCAKHMITACLEADGDKDGAERMRGNLKRKP